MEGGVRRGYGSGIEDGDDDTKDETGDEDNGMDVDQNSMGQRLRSRLGEEFEIVDVTSRQVVEQA